MGWILHIPKSPSKSFISSLDLKMLERLEVGLVERSQVIWMRPWRRWGSIEIAISHSVLGTHRWRILSAGYSGQDVLCYHEPTLTGPGDHGQQHRRQNKPFYFDHSDRKLSNTGRDMEDVSSSLCLSQHFLTPVFLLYPLMSVESFKIPSKVSHSMGDMKYDERAFVFPLVLTFHRSLW